MQYFYGFPTLQKVTVITHQSASKLENSCKQLAVLQKNIISQKDISLSTFFFPARLSPNIDASLGSFLFLLIKNNVYYICIFYLFIASHSHYCRGSPGTAEQPKLWIFEQLVNNSV